MVSLILIPSMAQGGIVGFGGAYQKEHDIDTTVTNTVTVSWTNIVYQANSTIQYRILPAPSNDLYNDKKGHQNESWSVHLTLYDCSGTLLQSETLRDARLSTPIKIEEGERYTAKVHLTLEDEPQGGRHSVRFVVVSSQYSTEDQANDSAKGKPSGAIVQESLATQQWVTVKAEENEPERSESWTAGAVVIFLIAALIAILLYVWHRRKTKEMEEKVKKRPRPRKRISNASK